MDQKDSLSEGDGVIIPFKHVQMTGSGSLGAPPEIILVGMYDLPRPPMNPCWALLPHAHAFMLLHPIRCTFEEDMHIRRG